MATANTTPEIQAQIDQLKQRIADLTALVVPEVNISDPIAGPDVLPNPTQTDIVDQINASFAIAAGALQTTTSALVTTVDNLLEDPTLSGNTTANGTLTIIGSTVANGGLMVVGDTTVVGATTANGTLVVSGNAQVSSLGVGVAASGSVGEIRAIDNITAYYSDDRLKTKLGKIENALDKIDQLTGFYYEANELAQSFGYKKVREVGVSAQDTQKVLGEIVAPAPIDERYLTIRYEKFAPLLIEGIKELRSELNKIKEHLNI